MAAVVTAPSSISDRRQALFRWGLVYVLDDDDQEDPLDSLDHRITGYLNFDVFGSLKSSTYLCPSSFFCFYHLQPGISLCQLSAFSNQSYSLQALGSIVSPLLSRSLHFLPSWSSNLGLPKAYYLSRLFPRWPPKRHVHILRSSSPGRVQYLLWTGPPRHLRFSLIAAPTFPYPASDSGIPLGPRLSGSRAPRQRSTSSPNRSCIQFS
jgi:hypothetical protein